MVRFFAAKNMKLSNIICFSMTLTFFGCQTLTSNDKGATDTVQPRKQIVLNSLDSGQIPQALKEIRELAKEYPNDPEILNLQGLVHLALKNTKVALGSFEKANKLDPENMTYILNLSSAWIQLGKHQKAEDLLLSKIGSPEFASYSHRDRLLHNLGVIAEHQDNSVRAELWYTKALEENPVSFISLMKIAQIFEKTHRQRLALDRLETAKAACPRCPEAVEALVRIHLKQHQPKAALRALESFQRNEALTSADSKRIIAMKKAIARYQEHVRK